MCLYKLCFYNFSRFENNKAAEIAVHKLHQLDVLGHKISAELARGKVADFSKPVDVRYVVLHYLGQKTTNETKQNTFAIKFHLLGAPQGKV